MEELEPPPPKAPQRPSPLWVALGVLTLVIALVSALALQLAGPPT